MYHLPLSRGKLWGEHNILREVNDKMAFLKWFCKRIILILIIICLHMTSGVIDIFGANAGMNPPPTQEDMQKMQRHIEKVKISNLGKYQTMIQRAGGNITHCCSCHVELCGGSIPGSTIIAPPAEQRIPPSIKKK